MDKSMGKSKGMSSTARSNSNSNGNGNGRGKGKGASANAVRLPTLLGAMAPRQKPAVAQRRAQRRRRAMGHALELVGTLYVVLLASCEQCMTDSLSCAGRSLQPSSC